MPVRIQRKRTKGWKMPEGAVNCTRPGRWGNPYSVREYGLARALANFRDRAIGVMAIAPEYFAPLRGKDLACWCHLCPRHQSGKRWNESCADCDPCHVDILLEIANSHVVTTEWRSCE